MFVLFSTSKVCGFNRISFWIRKIFCRFNFFMSVFLSNTGWNFVKYLTEFIAALLFLIKYYVCLDSINVFGIYTRNTNCILHSSKLETFNMTGSMVRLFIVSSISILNFRYTYIFRIRIEILLKSQTFDVENSTNVFIFAR